MSLNLNEIIDFSDEIITDKKTIDIIDFSDKINNDIIEFSDEKANNVIKFSDEKVSYKKVDTQYIFEALLNKKNVINSIYKNPIKAIKIGRYDFLDLDTNYIDENILEDFIEYINNAVCVILKNPIVTIKEIKKYDEIIKSIEELKNNNSKKHFKKINLKNKYNFIANKMNQNIRYDLIEERKDLLKLVNLLQIPFIDDELNIVDTYNLKNIKNIENNKEFCINYDGEAYKIQKNSNIKNNTKYEYILSQKNTKFIFSSHYEAYTAIMCGIENATISNLIIIKENNKINKNGIYLQIDDYNSYTFSLTINLQHVNNKILFSLNNDINKIINVIIPFYANKKNSFQIIHRYISNLLDEYEKSDNWYGLYINIYIATINKIYYLINSQWNNTEFDLMTIQCYRNECLHKNIYNKFMYNKNKDLKPVIVNCTRCRISSFCRKCTSSYCDGECENGKKSIDDISEENIKKTTKKCPNKKCNSPIYKIDGCNHVECQVCKIHFCYTCVTEYEKGNNGEYLISHHYIDNPIGRNNPNSVCRLLTANIF
jgi:hypothetical protein